MKKYNVYIAGGEKISEIYSSCITKACKSFIETLKKPAKYELYSREMASIRYTDNFTMTGNFVVIEA